MDKLLDIFFSYQGKMLRREYWYALIFVLIIANILGFYVGGVMAYVQQDPPPPNAIEPSMPLLMLVTIVLMLMVVAKVFLVAKRLTDIGIKKPWSLVSLIPVVGNMFAFIVGVIPSRPSV